MRLLDYSPHNWQQVRIWSNTIPEIKILDRTHLGGEKVKYLGKNYWKTTRNMKVFILGATIIEVWPSSNTKNLTLSPGEQNRDS